MCVPSPHRIWTWISCTTNGTSRRSRVAEGIDRGGDTLFSQIDPRLRSITMDQAPFDPRDELSLGRGNFLRAVGKADVNAERFRFARYAAPSKHRRRACLVRCDPQLRDKPP